MKKSFCFALILLFGFVVVLVGCGGSNGSPPLPSSLTVSPSSVSVIAAETKQFTATVQGSSNTAVTWSIAGSGCGDHCGSISQSGLYTAPSLIPQSATVTVTATLQADSSVTGTAVITHRPVTVSISPPMPASLICNATLQFTATVQNHSELGVTWHVEEVEGGSDTVGHISSTGLYSAPSSIPDPNTVAITAKSKADPTKGASAQVSIVTDNSGVPFLNGRYILFLHQGAFSYRQFVGSFVADGNGHITEGRAEYRDEIDMPSVSFTGSYSLSSTDLGNQGTLAIEPSAGVPFSVDFKLSSSTFGRLYSGGRMLGFLEKQDPAGAPYSDYALAGGWAFRMTGFAFASGNMTPADAIGRFGVGPGAFVASYDLTENQTFTDQNMAFNGALSVDATGRGVVTVSSSGRITGIVFYAISRDKLAMIQTSSTSPGLGLSGIAERQPDPNLWDDSALNRDYAFFLNGAIGRMTMDGGSSITAGNMDLVGDLNGTASLNNVAFTGNYQVNAFGRTNVTLNIPGQASINAVAYIVSPTKLYLMGLPGGPSGEAMAQTGKPFSTSSWQRDGIMALAGNTNTNYVGMFGYDWTTTAPGEAVLELDLIDSNATTRDITSHVNYTIAADGRVAFNLNLPAPIGAMNLCGYMVDSGRMLLLGIRSGLPLQGEANPFAW